MKLIIVVLVYLGLISLLTSILPAWLVGIAATLGIVFILAYTDFFEDAKPSSMPSTQTVMPLPRRNPYPDEEIHDTALTDYHLANTKPTIHANDDIELFREYNNKSLYQVEEELELLDLSIGESLITGESDSVILETLNESIHFPFALGFDRDNLAADKIGHCIFKIIPVYETEDSTELSDYICFGHPSNFIE